MKILQVNKYWRVRSKSDQYMFDLSQMLTEHGHEIIPFAMRDFSNRETPYSSLFVSPLELSPYRLSLLKKAGAAARILYSREARFRINDMIEVTDPDIAHLHKIYHEISPSILSPLAKSGVGIVMTVHDQKLFCPAHRSYIYHSGNACEECKPYRYLPCIKRKCVRGTIGASAICALELFVHDILGSYKDNVECFIAPSRFTADLLISRGYSPEKVTVIPYYVDSERWKPAKGKGDFVLFFGDLVMEEGINELIHTFAKLPEIPLKIVGTGMLQTWVRGLAWDLGAKNIEILGYQPEDEKRRLINESRFVCLPYTNLENISVRVLQSFACGKPVLTFAQGGLPEVVVEGETGALARPNDVGDLREAAERLWNDRALCTSMGKKARSLVKKEYTPELHYQRIMDVYSKVRKN